MIKIYSKASDGSICKIEADDITGLDYAILRLAWTFSDMGLTFHEISKKEFKKLKRSRIMTKIAPIGDEHEKIIFGYFSGIRATRINMVNHGY